MGCNCGKSKARKRPLENIKEVARNLWEKTQQEQKPVNVTKINKTRNIIKK